MEIDELLRIRELLDAKRRRKPQAPTDLWERMPQAKDVPVYRKFTPMAPLPKIPGFQQAQREGPRAISFAKISIPPPVEVKRAAPRNVRLKPTAFSLEEEF